MKSAQATCAATEEKPLTVKNVEKQLKAQEGRVRRAIDEKFDALRRDHRFDLGQLRRFAVMAWAKWG